MTTRDIGTTQRPPSSALLTIDSEDRFNNWREGNETTYANLTNFSPYNFTLKGQQALLNGYMTRLSIQQVVFPWCIPNINNYTNEIVLTGFDGATQITQLITIPYGFYTPSQLATKITSLVNALVPTLTGFSMVYGLNNIPAFSYTLTGTTNRINFISYNNLIANALYVNKDLMGVLGFDMRMKFANNPNAPSSTNIYGNPPITVSTLNYFTGSYTYAQSFRYIDICCPILTANQGLNDSSSQPVVRDALCRVFVSDIDNFSTANLKPSDSNYAPPGTYPSVINTIYQQPKIIQWNASMPINPALKFDVYDDTGQALDNANPFPTNKPLDWSMTILATEN